jgi:hypothetical protein
MKELGLPLGFMNKSPILVDDDGTVRLNESSLGLNIDEPSTSDNDSFIRNPKKGHNRRRVRKKVCYCVLQSKNLTVLIFCFQI